LAEFGIVFEHFFNWSGGSPSPAGFFQKYAGRLQTRMHGRVVCMKNGYAHFFQLVSKQGILMAVAFELFREGNPAEHISPDQEIGVIKDLWGFLFLSAAGMLSLLRPAFQCSIRSGGGGAVWYTCPPQTTWVPIWQVQVVFQKAGIIYLHVAVQEQQERITGLPRKEVARAAPTGIFREFFIAHPGQGFAARGFFPGSPFGPVIQQHISVSSPRVSACRWSSITSCGGRN
jgi:hypothetical protein